MQEQNRKEYCCEDPGPCGKSNYHPNETVEIKGTKFIFDEPTATRVETLRIGDLVSVLTKDAYSPPKVLPGVVLGFEPFREMPTVVVAVLDATYSEANIKLIAYNENATDVEIVKAVGKTKLLTIDRDEVERKLVLDIEAKERALEDARGKLMYFRSKFSVYYTSSPAKKDL